MQKCETWNPKSALDKFLEKYPRGSLSTMTLEQYTNCNKEDSFCHWLEYRAEDFGGIRGGLPIKFGIYRCRERTDRYQTDGKYAWKKGFGAKTSEEAFRIVRESLCKLAELASRQDIDAIEKFDGFGTMVKWKIAFIYSDEQLLPIYTKEKLVEVAKAHNHPNPDSCKMGELQEFLLEKCKEERKDVFAFYERFDCTWRAERALKRQRK